MFNGTTALVTIPNASVLQLTTGMTLEAWVNPTTVNNAWRDVIYKADDNYYLEGTSQNLSPAMGGTFSPTPLYGTTALTANTWTHLAATYDGTTMRLYVNGAQVASRAQTGNIATSTNPLQIGGDNLYGQHFAGMIDEVRLYNRALSLAEVQSDMNTPVGAPPPPPAPPVLATPANGSTGVATNPTLTWNASTGATSYHLQVSTDPNFGTTVVDQGGIATTSYTAGGLASSTTYYWHVNASNSGGTSSYSAVWNFTTGAPTLTISPNVAALTFTRTQQFTANIGNVIWLVDGVAGGSASTGTISPSGLYAPPSIAGTHTVTVETSDLLQSANATVYIVNHPGVFTHHYDNMRSGLNLNETVLTPANVTSASFGKLFSYPLDGLTLASPLYVPNVSIPGQGFHNVVYVATEHNSLYAFDADGVSSTPLWHLSFINPPSVTTVPCADVGECGDIPDEIGITGTPVIDPATQTMYVIVKTKEGTNYPQRLHALDITTGAEKFGGPVLIQATVPGTGVGSQNGQLPFLSLRELQRVALTLSNGVLYFGFGSHGDNEPYHGWAFGYNATTLQQTFVFCVTPNNEGGGIWQSGAGMAVDANGNIFFAAGDGTFTVDGGGIDYGDSYVRMSPTGAVLDYFTPYNQSNLDQSNLDVCAGGAIALPDQPGPHPHLLIGAGKNATIYTIDRDNMGHFNPNNDNAAVQTLPDIFPNANGTPTPGNYVQPVFFNGAMYFSPVSDNIQTFPMTNGLLTTAPTQRSSEVFPFPGGPLTISANGTSNAILWTVMRPNATSPGVLYAYDPADLGHVY